MLKERYLFFYSSLLMALAFGIYFYFFYSQLSFLITKHKKTLKATYCSEILKVKSFKINRRLHLMKPY